MNQTTPEAARRLHQSGQLEDAEAAYRKLIDKNPGQLDVALALTYLLRDQGRLQAAARVILRWWQQSGQRRLEGVRVVTLLTDMNQATAAGPVIDSLIRRFPHDAAVLEQAAMIAQARGKFDQAAILLRKTLELDPDRPGAWLRLAHGQKFASTDHEDARALARRLNHNPPAELEIPLQFAFGKVMDDVGAYEKAAAAWGRGNDLARKHRPETASPPARPAGMSPGNWPDLPDLPGGQQPVFIIGMPRSGTTLLASRLAGYPDVRDRGELNWLGILLRHLPAHPDRSVLQSLRSHYLAQLVQDDGPAQWYIDQNPRNFYYLDVISRLFPKAAVLHCRRQPAAVALSIWSQLFAHPEMRWSHSFTGIQKEFGHYRVALDEYERPAAFMDVGYENLVTEPDAILDIIARQLGLSSDRAEDSSQAQLATASLWQARQPVYTTSVNRWQHYTDHIPELKSFTSKS